MMHIVPAVVREKLLRSQQCVPCSSPKNPTLRVVSIVLYEKRFDRHLEIITRTARLDDTETFPFLVYYPVA